jgi:drug/metabolite transporter (DMT)-like permease
MRTLSRVELALLTAIGLWALNVPVTRYLLTEGFAPLVYSTLRYGIALVIFGLILWRMEGRLGIRGRDLALTAVAGAVLYVNQLAFVYALETTPASVVALVLGSTPVFAAVIGLVLGLEVLGMGFWVGSAVSLAGVGFVALAHGTVGGDVTGVLLAVLTAFTWAVYSILVGGLTRRHSPAAISVVVLALSWVAVGVTGAGQVTGQSWDLDWTLWLIFAFSTLGPLVVTNFLWFRSVEQIGAARATLATNLQPFLSAMFAVVLLSETIHWLQAVGGALIAVGILVARRWGRRGSARTVVAAGVGCE